MNFSLFQTILIALTSGIVGAYFGMVAVHAIVRRAVLHRTGSDIDEMEAGV